VIVINTVLICCKWNGVNSVEYINKRFKTSETPHFSGTEIDRLSFIAVSQRSPDISQTGEWNEGNGFRSNCDTRKVSLIEINAMI